MGENKLTLELFKGDYGVCRLSNDEDIPTWAKGEEFVSITKTSDELSIVCPIENIPEGINCEKNWRILKILGPLDFALIGILSKISSILANEKISIFAISTFDTDYILVKEEDIDNATKALSTNGYNIV